MKAHKLPEWYRRVGMYGAIKRPYASICIRGVVKFQFLYGAIKRRLFLKNTGLISNTLPKSKVQKMTFKIVYVY